MGVLEEVCLCLTKMLIKMKQEIVLYTALISMGVLNGGVFMSKGT